LQAVGQGAQDYLLKRQLSGAALVRAIESAIKRNRAAGGARPNRPKPGRTKRDGAGLRRGQGGVGSTTWL